METAVIITAKILYLEARPGHSWMKMSRLSLFETTRLTKYSNTVSPLTLP